MFALLPRLFLHHLHGVILQWCSVGVIRLVGATLMATWKWILTEVSRLRSGRLSQKKTTQQLRETDP